MPHYRYRELENDLEQNEAVLFGLFAFSKKFAMTYEIPLAMARDRVFRGYAATLPSVAGVPA